MSLLSDYVLQATDALVNRTDEYSKIKTEVFKQ